MLKMTSPLITDPVSVLDLRSNQNREASYGQKDIFPWEYCQKIMGSWSPLSAKKKSSGTENADCGRGYQVPEKRINRLKRAAVGLLYWLLFMPILLDRSINNELELVLNL